MMRRKLLLLSLLLILSFSGVIYAAGINGQYNGKNIVKVLSDGKEVKPDAVPGYIESGNTMVPLGLLRKMGIIVEWDQKTLTANVKLPTRTVPVLIQSQLDELAKAVYKITTAPTSGYPNGKQGSGFIIDGYMITAAHVASDADYAQALINGSWQRTSKYDFVNNKDDSMGFKVTGGISLPYSSELPQVGDPVYSIGYPSGVMSITEGEVLEIWPDNGVLIRHSAKIESGSSGGILLNGKGQIIGLNSSGLTLNGEKMYFAIPINRVIDEFK